VKIQVRGQEVFYGTGSGHPAADAPTIVFVHGAGFDHAVWVMPARYFARHGCRVLAPDLPGHGRSEGPALTTVEDMVDWLAEFVQASLEGLAKTPVTVVGHSMGSLIAMSFASKYATLTDRIALLGVAAPMPVGAVLLDAAGDNHHAAIDMANSWSHSQSGHMVAGQSPGISNINSGERWLERMSEGIFHADLAACNAFTAPIDIANTPALLILGGADRMTPVKVGKKVAAALTDARVVVLSKCGHAMLSEQPNQVLDALINFLVVRN